MTSIWHIVSLTRLTKYWRRVEKVEYITTFDVPKLCCQITLLQWFQELTDWAAPWSVLAGELTLWASWKLMFLKSRNELRLGWSFLQIFAELEEQFFFSADASRLLLPFPLFHLSLHHLLVLWTTSAPPKSLSKHYFLWFSPTSDTANQQANWFGDLLQNISGSFQVSKWK